MLKQYRSFDFDTDNALQSIQILQYQKKNGYPVVTIVPTARGDTHVMVETPLGPSVAMLFDYIEGAEPGIDQEIAKIGQQVGRPHRIMKEYLQPLAGLFAAAVHTLPEPFCS